MPTQSKLFISVHGCIAKLYAATLICKPLPWALRPSTGSGQAEARSSINDTVIPRERLRFFYRLFGWLICVFPVCLFAIAAEAQVSMLPDTTVTVTPRLGVSGMIAVSAGNDRSILIDLDRGISLGLPLRAVEPVFSPDGQFLLTTASYNQTSQIWLSTWNGAKAIPVSENSYSASDGAWSQDGKEIWFSNELFPGNKELFKVALASTLPDGLLGLKPSPPVQVTHFGGRNTTPKLSPDGTFVAFSTDRFWPGWNVCVLSLASTKSHCLFNSAAASYCRPGWSPDGDQLAYSFGVGEEINLGLINWPSESFTSLPTLPHKEYDVAWSPDGKYLAFVNNPYGDGLYRLHIMRLSDKAQALVASSTRSLRAPNWTTSKQYELLSEDACSEDPWKSSPGTCGCGVPDIDSDADDTLDCLDACPLDPSKQTPGACGCTVKDDDSDSDGTPDCIDHCPSDTRKTTQGICGCGNEDPLGVVAPAACNGIVVPSPTATRTATPSQGDLRELLHLKLRAVSAQMARLEMKLPKASNKFFTVKIRYGKQVRIYPKVNSKLVIYVPRHQKIVILYHKNNTGVIRSWSQPVELRS